MWQCGRGGYQASDARKEDYRGWRLYHWNYTRPWREKNDGKASLEGFEEPLDCIIFGHSHIPYVRFASKTLLFNPGSATSKRKMPYYSFGVLTVGEELKTEHIFYENKE
ncbi:metallophosphoesterase [Thalassobacillus sp. C254]|uniref:metallophosphoesterase family protein n=1 Tax=Thalassobacillus sp. C254 TaxID=1225341 RepID=UPI00277D0B50|nr:metallophosphoesterase family protein [Thalassobacillus sp. C254]